MALLCPCFFMKHPPGFIKTIQSTFGDKGREWLSQLPELIADASKRWGLSNVKPVPNLSYNFVAFAKRGVEDVVLKIGVPNRELVSEMAALRLFNGEGVCQLLECDEEGGMSLLERLKPGTTLSEMEDDDGCTHIAIDVMENLILRGGGAAPPLQNKFINLSDWFDGLKKIRPRFGGGVGPFPKEILRRVEASLPGLFDDEARLIHGDFHHYNVLLSERGWLAIDPKGVIGPVGYEIGPLMLNPWIKPMDGSRFEVRTKRRVDIIHERLGRAREVIIEWALAHAVLSAWWDFQDAMDWEYSMRCARIFLKISP